MVTSQQPLTTFLLTLNQLYVARKYKLSIHNHESTKRTLDNESPKCTMAYILGHYGYTYYMCGTSLWVYHKRRITMALCRLCKTDTIQTTTESEVNIISPYLPNRGSPEALTGTIRFLMSSGVRLHHRYTLTHYVATTFSQHSITGCRRNYPLLLIALLPMDKNVIVGILRILGFK